MCRPTLPCWPELSTKLWKQKRRGSKILSAPIPIFRPSHCPYMRISNVKACPRRAIYIHYDLTLPNIHICRNTLIRGHTLLIYIGNQTQGYKITHANASVASPLCLDSKLRSLNTQTVTFRKRPFETALQTAWCLVPSMLFIRAHPLLDRHLRVQR